MVIFKYILIIFLISYRQSILIILTFKVENWIDLPFQISRAYTIQGSILLNEYSHFIALEMWARIKKRKEEEEKREKEKKKKIVPST